MSVTIGKRAFEVILKYMFEEFANSYNYISMSSVLKDMGLANCATWALKMSEDSRCIAMSILQHLEDRGIRTKLAPVAVGRQDWRAPLHIFEESYRQEQKLSGLIAAIYESAVADKDYITIAFIMSYFEKHAKIEKQVLDLLNRLRKMQTSDMGVFEFEAGIKSLI